MVCRWVMAADAMAEGSTVGIGGWISMSQSFAWFSEQWDMTEVRKHWPQLTKNAQAYIACFKTLAQQPSFYNHRTAQQLSADRCRMVVSTCKCAPRIYTPRKERLGRRAQPQPHCKISTSQAERERISLRRTGSEPGSTQEET